MVDICRTTDNIYTLRISRVKLREPLQFCAADTVSVLYPFGPRLGSPDLQWTVPTYTAFYSNTCLIVAYLFLRAFSRTTGTCSAC